MTLWLMSKFRPSTSKVPAFADLISDMSRGMAEFVAKTERRAPFQAPPSPNFANTLGELRIQRMNSELPPDIFGKRPTSQGSRSIKHRSKVAPSAKCIHSLRSAKFQIAKLALLYDLFGGIMIPPSKCNKRKHKSGNWATPKS